MYSYDRQIAKQAAVSELWSKAEADLRTFNERYEEIHRLYKADDSEGIDKLLNDFAFRKNGTAPSFPGSDFRQWMDLAFRGEVDDPEAVRPQGVMIMAVVDGELDIEVFFGELDNYRDAIQAVVNATAPAKFTYQGFSIENKQHMGDALCRRLLEGVDYVTALFKKRGIDKLLDQEVKLIQLVPKNEKETHLGYYYANSKTIQLSALMVGMGAGRFMKWVNEAFLHEFGHHVHLNYLKGEARAVWDSDWAEIDEKKEAIELAFKNITFEERQLFFTTLMATGWDPSKAAKRLEAVQKVKFGVWLRDPTIGGPLITDKQFRLTKDGQFVATFFRDPVAFLKDHYDLAPGEERYDDQMARSTKQMRSKLGLNDKGPHHVPVSIVEELTKSDTTMQKAVEDALEKLDIVSPYGKENKMEDFAETFVAFVGAPEKLTPTAKFRMQRTLSVSGLYGKPVMRLAERVAEAFKARRNPQVRTT